MRAPNRRTPWLVALATGGAALFAVAACGASGGGGGGGTTGTGDGAAPGLAAYVNCLKQQGIDVSGLPTARPSGMPGERVRPSGFPSGRPSGWPSGHPSAWPSVDGSRRPGARPGGGGFGLRPSGVDEATWEKAQQACRSALPSRRPGGGPGRGPSGAPGGGPGSDAAYRNCLADHGVSAPPTAPADPAVEAARDACSVLSPAPAR